LALQALDEFAAWHTRPEALEMASLIADTNSERAQSRLAELILSGELDASPPHLNSCWMAALSNTNPSRLLRALQRLDATSDPAAAELVRIVKGHARADLRYAALRALDRSGRAGSVPQQIVDRIYAEYEDFVRSQ